MSPRLLRVGSTCNVLLALAGCSTAPVSAPAPAPLMAAKDMVLPAETVFWRSSPLPGFALVQEKCQICHSAHYAEYQPTTSPRPYWEAQMKRMKNVFKAPIQDQDIPVLVDYLVKTYGAESGR